MAFRSSVWWSVVHGAVNGEHGQDGFLLSWSYDSTNGFCCWFGARWFRIRIGIPLRNNPFYFSGILGIQTTGPKTNKLNDHYQCDPVTGPLIAEKYILIANWGVTLPKKFRQGPRNCINHPFQWWLKKNRIPSLKLTFHLKWMIGRRSLIWAYFQVRDVSVREDIKFL